MYRRTPKAWSCWRRESSVVEGQMSREEEEPQGGEGVRRTNVPAGMELLGMGEY